jgi:hypothetical protein
MATQAVAPIPAPISTSTTTPTHAEITAKEEQLDTMKNLIERMNKIQHIEVLKILKKYPNVKLNENRNGVYINLSYLPQATLDDLNLYIKYVEEQEKNLSTIEVQKEEFKSTFFLDSH